VDEPALASGRLWDPNVALDIPVPMLGLRDLRISLSRRRISNFALHPFLCGMAPDAVAAAVLLCLISRSNRPPEGLCTNSWGCLLRRVPADSIRRSTAHNRYSAIFLSARR
jgi:hypothetical protein